MPTTSRLIEGAPSTLGVVPSLLGVLVCKLASLEWQTRDFLLTKAPLSAGRADSHTPHPCSAFTPTGDSVLQRYLEPMLIHDHKFDMRLYVLVTDFDPLTVYLHSNGLVRFASQKYSSSSGPPSVPRQRHGQPRTDRAAGACIQTPQRN